VYVSIYLSVSHTLQQLVFAQEDKLWFCTFSLSELRNT